MPRAIVTPDAAMVPSALGGACGGARTCAGDQRCLPGSGGYCASACGLAGAPCAGTCVETPTVGELCLASCGSHDDCRVNEGYVCDAQWNACTLASTPAIKPRDCPVPIGIARDPAFAPAVALSTAASGLYQSGPTAVVADDGSVVALYATEGNRLALARVDARGPTLDVPFPTGHAASSEPWLARDATGKLLAVWLGVGAAGTREIAMATSADRGVTWDKPVAVHDAADCTGVTDCVARPMVIVGPDPQRRGAWITYVAYASSGLRVRASRDGGATFAPARTPLVGGHGSLTVGPDGLLYAVALDGGPRGAYGSGDQRVQFAATGDGGRSWTRPQTISRNGELLPFYFATPAIALDNARRWLYLVYVRGGRDAKWDLVIAATADRGKTWRRSIIGDDPACAIHMAPLLAVDPTTGTLHVAWYDSRGMRFAHATCAPGVVGCRQVGRINDTPFAALSTLRHGPRWLGDYESLLVDNARRTLHAVWTQPVDDGGRIVSRIFHAKAKLPLR